MARPNPECPPFIKWPGVASHRAQERVRLVQAHPVLPNRGFFSCLPAELQSVVLDTSQLGITLRGLRKLKKVLSETFGDKFPDMSTAEVNTKWVELVTAERRCRLVEMAELVAPEDVAPPMYFISHTWMNKTERLLDYVMNFLSHASDTVAVWLDILCVNQHEETLTHQHDVHPHSFSSVVKACNAGTLVVMDTAVVSPATRAWCIFEWAHTLLLHGPDGLHLHLQPGDRAELLGSINVTDAKCFRPEDKVMILGEVTRYHTSPEAFDTKLKLQLLLEPLSYRVDVQRLTRQAAAMGTQWVFDGVDAWLASECRVLCIAAGAGEGKSTISAALWHHWSPEQVLQPAAGSASPVAVCHFLKYSDQRRLDPIRIIKSIAFQLAERIPAVGQQLLLLDVAEVAQMAEMEQAFTKLLLQPLQALVQQQETVVVIIDALDEADPLELQLASSSGGKSTCPKAGGNVALLLITNHLCHLPPFVRFIFTTRQDAAAGQVLPCLERTTRIFSDSVLHMLPSALRRMDSSDSSSCSGQGGVMVYHSAVAACEGNVPVSQPLQVPQLKDVYAVYGRVFEAARAQHDSDSTFGQTKSAMIGDLLAVLMAAKEPLSQSFLQQLGLGAAIPLLPGYPKLFFVDEHHIYLMHKSLADWLLDPAISGVFAARVHQGHARLGLHLAGLWRQQQQHKVLGGSSSSPYLLKYVVTHLAAASGDAAATAESRHGTVDNSSDHGGASIQPASAAAELDLLLQDFGFLATALKAGHGPTIIGALGAMRTHTVWSYDVLRWLRSDLYSLAGRTAVELAERAVWNRTPGNTMIYQLAARTAGQPWRMQAVKPDIAGDWPDCMAVLQGHTKEVACLGFSPDGRQLVTGSDDGTLRVWDTATGQSTAKLGGHHADILCVAFSPDGRQLASGSNDNTLRLWDTATGQCTATLEAVAKGVAFSPDGRHLASGGDSTLRLWDPVTGQNTATLVGHTEPASSVAFSPDGGQMASGSDDGTIRIWDVATGQCTATLLGHESGVLCVAYSPDGRQLASGSKDKTLRLWDMVTGECTATLNRHRDQVLSVAFSPDGRQLVSGSADRTDMPLLLWDPATAQLTAVLQGQTRSIRSVAFSPDGRQLATGCRDQTVWLWDTTFRHCIAKQAGGHRESVQVVAFSPDGRQLASGNKDKPVRLWDTATMQCAAALEGHEGDVRCVAFSPDGQQLASGSGDRTLRLWDTTTGQCTATLQPQDLSTVYCVAFSPDGRQLVSSGMGSDDPISLWDPATGQCTATMSGFKGRVSCLAYSPDGRQLASSHIRSGALHLWDPSTGQCTATLPGHTDASFGVAFSPDGRQLASGGGDNIVRLWDVATGQCTATLAGHGAWVLCVAFSPDGRELASGGDDYSIRLWDTATGQCTATLGILTGHVTSLAYSRDGRNIANGCSDGTLRLWNAATVQRPTLPISA